MRMQDSQASCGVYALHNALCALGVSRTAEELAVLCKVTATDGTSPTKMRHALQSLRDGCALTPWSIKARDVGSARGLLWLAMHTGRPLVAVVDNDDHWVAVVGHLSHKLIVADSALNELVVSVEDIDFMKRWAGGGRYPYVAEVL